MRNYMVQMVDYDDDDLNVLVSLTGDQLNVLRWLRCKGWLNECFDYTCLEADEIPATSNFIKIED